MDIIIKNFINFVWIYSKFSQNEHSPYSHTTSKSVDKRMCPYLISFTSGKITRDVEAKTVRKNYFFYLPMRN